MIKCSEIEQGKVVTDMMVACLIFNQSEISKDSIKQILISEFKWNEYEFFETEDKLILYLWNVVKMDIWQIVLRSEEHTSELQSRGHLVCRLLLEKKNTKFE